MMARVLYNIVQYFDNVLRHGYELRMSLGPVMRSSIQSVRLILTMYLTGEILSNQKILFLDHHHIIQ